MAKNLISQLFAEPEKPLNEKLPVICVWKINNERRESRQPNLTVARMKSVKLIGMDDRITVKIYDARTKEPRGKVGLYAGCPYWHFKGKIHSLNAKGEVLTDLYEY